ncbi:glycosyltransferase family 1 protein [Patescibacteria group bacterium]|nr:MAG: glycosyltransferase family 1 protein [Patescibacteria group bacterium]
MKILIITLEYPPQIGGIASYVYNYCAHSPANDIIVYAPKTAGGENFDKKNSWPVYRRKPYWFLWPHWLRLIWQIKKIIRTEKISAIHVHHALPLGYVARYFWSRKKIPYTIFFHGADLELGARFKRRQLESVCRAASAVIVNSEFTRNKFAGAFEAIPLEKIKIIYPCPADIFFAKEPPEKLTALKSQLALSGKKVILTVSRIGEGKGYPHLARLLPQILEKIPNAVWLIVGDGPKRAALMEQIQKNSLQNTVRYVGQISYEELPKYYQTADLFVLLTHPDDSRGEEGWGTVFLEAAASGLPVVAGRSGAVEEVVKHLETGLVVDVYQDMSVVAAVVDLLREAEYGKKMGAAGRARAEAEFKWEKQLCKV